FLLLKDCELVVERYKTGVTREHNHAIYSVTKSVVSTLVGALIKERRLAGIDAEVTKSGPRPAPTRDPNWERASMLTLKHAMNMATGYEYTHNAAESPLYGERVDRLAWA